MAILCRTRVEWSLADYALSTIGAVVIPVYPTSSPSEIAFILRDSETKMLLSEDEEQLAKTRDFEGDAARARARDRDRRRPARTARWPTSTQPGAPGGRAPGGLARPRPRSA